MTIYCPEMHELAPAAPLLHIHHVINSTHSARWHPSREAEVMALFKKLRIRPRLISASELRDGSTQRWALITQAASSKLCHRPDVAAEMFLD